MSQIENKLIDFVQQAKVIFKEELDKTRIKYDYAEVGILPNNIKSTGIMGDGRAYGFVAIIELRDKESRFIWKPESKLIERLSTRITNEVKGINRVVYDITNPIY